MRYWNGQDISLSRSELLNDVLHFGTVKVLLARVRTDHGQEEKYFGCLGCVTRVQQLQVLFPDREDSCYHHLCTAPFRKGFDLTTPPLTTRETATNMKQCRECSIFACPLVRHRRPRCYSSPLPSNTLHCRGKSLSDNTLESSLEPLDSIVTGNLVSSTDSALRPPSSGNSGTRSRPKTHN